LSRAFTSPTTFPSRRAARDERDEEHPRHSYYILPFHLRVLLNAKDLIMIFLRFLPTKKVSKTVKKEKAIRRGDFPLVDHDSFRIPD